MTLPETAVLAVIKALRPAFRSNNSKIALAVHAYLEASGCTLVACGLAEQKDDVGSAPEATLEGWDVDDSCYQFQYRTLAKQSLVVKCLPVEDNVIVHWALSGADIKSVEVSTADYTTDDNSTACGFKNMQALINLISPGLDIEMQGLRASASPAATSQSTRQDERHPHGRSERQGEALQEPRPHFGNPDLYPGGMPNPLMIGSGSGQGGMHVGPNDPLFGNVRRGWPKGRGGLLPPGARYDPIAPEGLPGFHPDDFTHGQSREDAWNDIGPPPGMGGPFRQPRGFGGPGGPGFGGGMFG